MFLFVLSLCGFASSMSGRILDPVVTDIAAEFGMPVSAIALLATAYAVPFAIAQPILGPLGDLFSKPFIVKASVVLLVLFSAMAALAASFEILLIARVLAGAAGAGIVPIGFALIGDRIPLANRQIAISRFVAATLIGQLVGAAIAGMLASIFGWRNVLWLVTSITLAIAAGAIGILRSGEPARSRGLSLAVIGQNYGAVLRNPFAYACFGVVVVEGICIHGSLPFIGEYLTTLGAGGVREAGFVISAMAVGGLAFAFSVPLLLQVMRRPPMMALGGSVAAVGLAGLALGLDWPIDAVFMGIVGFGFFCLHNPVQTEVSELAPSARASAFSLHAFSFYVGQAAGPVLYGAGLHAIGLSASFMIAGIGLLITGIAAYSLLRRAHQSTGG